MAKTKSKRSRREQAALPSFGEIHNQLNLWRSVLRCAVVTLDSSDDHGASEVASRAGNVLHACAENLDRISNQLDSWDVRHEHTPRSRAVATDLGEARP